MFTETHSRKNEADSAAAAIREQMAAFDVTVSSGVISSEHADHVVPAFLVVIVRDRKDWAAYYTEEAVDARGMAWLVEATVLAARDAYSRVRHDA
jgi:hypothetical protein